MDYIRSIMDRDASFAYLAMTNDVTTQDLPQDDGKESAAGTHLPTP